MRNMILGRIFIALGVLLFAPIYAIGQNNSIVFADQETRSGVPFVSYQVQKGSEIISGFSDKNGRISLGAISFPFSLKTSHVSFEPFESEVQSTDTVFISSKFNSLDEVVVLGRYEEGSAAESMIKVTSLKPRELESRGAVTLSQAVQYQLNYSLEPDPATGSVGLSIQGMDGQQVKVLLDGVPLTGRTGNAVDLSQINIANVERIELVEGPMAIQYGTDAMAGAINIVSKKPVSGKPFVRIDLQEETVGDAYALDEGIHQQNVFAGVGFGKFFYSQLEFGHRYFGGFQGNLEGREKLWDPKRNIYGNFRIGMKPLGAKLEYRLDLFDEKIDSKASPSGLLVPIALDEEYLTRRYIHQINGHKSLSTNSKLDFVGSFTDFTRIKKQYVHNLTTGEKILSTADGSQDTSSLNAIMFRTMYTHSLSGRFEYQFGLDLNYEEGQGGRIQGVDNKSIGDYAVFGSIQAKLNSRFEARVGLRASYHTNYNAPVLPSLNLKYALSPGLSLRASFAQGFRAPTIKELYFTFFDSNHRVLGNDELRPEYSNHFDLSLTHTKKLGEYQLGSEISAFYNDVQDQIAFGQDPGDPTITTYLNNETFRSLGFTIRENLNLEKWTMGIGFGYTGRYNQFSDTSELSPFLWTPELTANLSYTPGVLGLSFNLFYKYNGPLPQYFLEDIGQNQQKVSLGQRDPFHWMDLSITKSFKQNLQLVAGIKNLLDVSSVFQGVQTGATHGSGSQYFVGYGRSYFLKIIYRINTN